MSGLFISYRREDAQGWAGRLSDSLKSSLRGVRTVRDIDDIPPGADFTSYIKESVASSKALVVLIGPAWLRAANAAGESRLKDPDDFVRVEIETALKHGVHVIPALVGGAVMPAIFDLPETIQPLAKRQSYRLSDDHWNDDIARLVRILRPMLLSRGQRLRPGVSLAALTLATAIAVGMAYNYVGRQLDERLETAWREGERAASEQFRRALAASAAAEKAIVERAEAEKLAQERAALAKAATEKAAADRAAVEKVAADRAAAEREAAVRAADLRRSNERAAQERATADKATRERAASQLATEKAEAERKSKERLEAERLGALRRQEERREEALARLLAGNPTTFSRTSSSYAVRSIEFSLVLNQSTATFSNVSVSIDANSTSAKAQIDAIRAGKRFGIYFRLEKRSTRQDSTVARLCCWTDADLAHISKGAGYSSGSYAPSVTLPFQITSDALRNNDIRAWIYVVADGEDASSVGDFGLWSSVRP